MTTALVHPGSLLGHAWTSVGAARAREVRANIIEEDISPADHVALLLDDKDQDLFEGSDLDRKVRGDEYLRVSSDIPAIKWAARVGLKPFDGPFLVTGAWGTPQTGCATTLARHLRGEGREAYLSKNALQPEGGMETPFDEPEELRDRLFF